MLFLFFFFQIDSFNSWEIKTLKNRVENVGEDDIERAETKECGEIMIVRLVQRSKRPIEKIFFSTYSGS